MYITISKSFICLFTFSSNILFHSSIPIILFPCSHLFYSFVPTPNIPFSLPLIFYSIAVFLFILFLFLLILFFCSHLFYSSIPTSIIPLPFPTNNILLHFAILVYLIPLFLPSTVYSIPQFLLILFLFSPILFF